MRVFCQLHTSIGVITDSGFCDLRAVDDVQQEHRSLNITVSCQFNS